MQALFFKRGKIKNKSVQTATRCAIASPPCKRIAGKPVEPGKKEGMGM
jgi:hypothetical protein